MGLSSIPSSGCKTVELKKNPFTQCPSTYKTRLIASKINTDAYKWGGEGDTFALSVLNTHLKIKERTEHVSALREKERKPSKPKD